MTLTSSSSGQLLRPRVGITIGDPSGIGPEVALKAAFSQKVLDVCVPVLIGDAPYLAHWSEGFQVRGAPEIIEADGFIPLDSSVPLIYNIRNLLDPITMGQEQAAAGRAAGQYIEAAARLCLTGQLNAVATAPINKSALHLGGYTYPGHTEMFAHLTGTQDFAMSFIAPNLRVALLTTHLPLSEVPKVVKQEPLRKLIQLVHQEMARFGITQPRIAVAALNPHGGEAGLFGKEEAQEMLPAIQACRNSYGIEVSGPYSGDTIFLRAAKGEFDIVISCYHDQGLIPIKCFSFGEAVNVTLGLPFIRTSVDHGTGFDIAGRGQADPASMITAITLAATLAQETKQ